MKLKDRTRAPATKMKLLDGQYWYDWSSSKPENFAIRDFLLPPCSIPRKGSTHKIVHGGKTVFFDCHPAFIDQRQRLTPELIDRLYEHVIRTHSIDAAAGIHCVPVPTLYQWMRDGQKYIEVLMKGETPVVQHALRYQLYFRLMQAKALQQSEKRARLMQKVPDRDWFRIMNVLERMEPEDFGNKKGGAEGMRRKPEAEALGDESYM